ncbi:MAG: EVE domain-containing protein, partial [Chloroflexi bacterium]|nr:EVE domain-containing protein [Chloroflexota bacterium]
QAIGAILTVTGPYYEDHSDLWTSKKEGEGYPFRFPTQPSLILDEPAFIPVQTLVPHLIYPKRWPEAHWRLAFQGNVHVFGDEDYGLIAEAVRSAQGAGVRA